MGAVINVTGDHCFWCDGVCFQNGTASEGVFTNESHTCDRLSGTFPGLWWLYYLHFTNTVVIVFSSLLIGYLILFADDGKRRKNVLYCLILGQLIPDFLLGFGSPRMWSMVLTGNPMYNAHETFGCKFEAWFYALIPMMSLMTAMLTSYERYRAVFTPMQRLGRKTALSAYCALWVFGIIYVTAVMAVVPESSTLTYIKASCIFNFYGEPGLHGGNASFFFATFVIITPCVNATGYAYSKVYIEINQKAEELDFSEDVIKKMRMFARSLIIIFIFLLICCAPISIHIFLVSFNLVGENYYKGLPWGEIIGNTLILMNSVANPVLVLIFVPELRMSAKETVRSLSNRLLSGKNITNAFFSSKRLSTAVSPSTAPRSSDTAGSAATSIQSAPSSTINATPDAVTIRRGRGYDDDE